MKKLLSMLLVFATVLSLAVPCAAVEVPEIPQPNVNVSTVNPMDMIALYGEEYPSARHYMHTDGSRTFSGSPKDTMIYLNYMVFDCTTYIIDIYNVASTVLHCTVLRERSGDFPVYVQPHSSVSIRVSAHPKEILCMSFNAPSNFNGRIRCGCSG